MSKVRKDGLDFPPVFQSEISSQYGARAGGEGPGGGAVGGLNRAETRKTAPRQRTMEAPLASPAL